MFLAWLDGPACSCWFGLMTLREITDTSLKGSGAFFF